uniref:Uncharacterized protein n=1 Tax=Esox lucius TaxID=8010 RepID=A0AAY5K6Y2_ESOLU
MCVCGGGGGGGGGGTVVCSPPSPTSVSWALRSCSWTCRTSSGSSSFTTECPLPNKNGNYHSNGSKPKWQRLSSRVIKEKLSARSPRKVPLLKKRHVLKRLQFTKELTDWPKEKWRNILCSDESKIVLFGSQ